MLKEGMYQMSEAKKKYRIELIDILSGMSTKPKALKSFGSGSQGKAKDPSVQKRSHTWGSIPWINTWLEGPQLLGQFPRYPDNIK